MSSNERAPVPDLHKLVSVFQRCMDGSFKRAGSAMNWTDQVCHRAQAHAYKFCARELSQALRKHCAEAPAILKGASDSASRQKLSLPAPNGSLILRRRRAAEWKIVAVRETSTSELPICEMPDHAVQYWRQHVAAGALFNPDVECFVTLLLNTKFRIRGHHLVSIGSLNETMAHPREVFRAAVIGAAYAVVLIHNHPSGDPTASHADTQITRVLADAGRTLRIDVRDHIIIGQDRHFSFREAGLL